jgi:hypothetical protein
MSVLLPLLLHVLLWDILPALLSVITWFVLARTEVKDSLILVTLACAGLFAAARVILAGVLGIWFLSADLVGILGLHALLILVGVVCGAVILRFRLWAGFWFGLYMWFASGLVAIVLAQPIARSAESSGFVDYSLFARRYGVGGVYIGMSEKRARSKASVMDCESDLSFRLDCTPARIMMWRLGEVQPKRLSIWFSGSPDEEGNLSRFPAPSPRATDFPGPGVRVLAVIVELLKDGLVMGAIEGTEGTREEFYRSWFRRAYPLKGEMVARGSHSLVHCATPSGPVVILDIPYELPERPLRLKWLWGLCPVDQP